MLPIKPYKDPFRFALILGSDTEGVQEPIAYTDEHEAKDTAYQFINNDVYKGIYDYFMIIDNTFNVIFQDKRRL